MNIIIFLDIDGVLCTPRQSYATGEMGTIAGLDPVALMFLNRICRQYNCKIVISSTWRIGSSSDEFYKLFAAGGYIDLAKSLHTNWSTPTLSHAIRGIEIEQWLLTNDPDTEYLILDDDSDMLPYQQSRLIQTNGEEGMLMNDYIAMEQRICDMLGIKNVNV